MAKKAYVGVSGASKNVTAIYVGVNGVPKKVVKGYVGVNGVPKLFWDGAVQILPSWHYWKSDTGLVFWDDDSSDVMKVNDKIAYYAIAPSTVDGYFVPIFMSPDSDAVTLQIVNYSTGTTETYGSSYTLEDDLGITWYCACPASATLDYSPPYPVYCLTDEPASVAEYAQEMLDRIYSIPYHENYVVGQTYQRYISDRDWTIRKLLGVFLFKNINIYSTNAAYKTISDNMETVIFQLLIRISNWQSTDLVYIYTTISSTQVSIALYRAAMMYPSLEGLIEDQNSSEGFEYLDVDSGGQVTYLGAIATADSNGNITYTTNSYSMNGYTIGVKAVPYTSASKTYIRVTGFNLGMDI